MRELETSSTVIWPSWCYTGDLDPKQRGRMNGPSPTTGSTAIDILNNNNTTTNNNSSSTGASSNSGGSVKAERFSPPTGDNNSTSSRSGTPVSSYEGVGGGRGSPMALSLSQARERDPLKAMEQATSRNYSDFMRSLAAKYNHTNPNEKKKRNIASKNEKEKNEKV
ncbi:hypothetical protein LSTR_LSTR009267 [Laodelphax striatellus]|uniref:Uncharacterized protein n=1 Tax=Laodelphax striatellus TaxID=195883 RepID=A0A482WI15_LAOST|nr:hypothetical protein LSTR_LSTR009267 [Laodelphax striatellus]